MADSRRPARAVRRRRRRRAVLRPTLTAAVLLVLYFAAPLDEVSDARSWILLVAVFGVVGVVVGWQYTAIVRSPTPAVQAVEAFAVAVPLYLLGFSVLYYLMAAAGPDSFSQSLSRMASLYFTVTVFSTVGFGDILAVSDTGRAVVTTQMIANLVLLGIGGRILFGAVERARDRATGPDRG
ncbi:MAG TPA: potassium channel family protein [Aldersonia sp.]